MHATPELKMYFVSLLVSLAFACLLQSGHCQPGDPCPAMIDEPSCVCNHPDGEGVINATSLGLKAPDGPKYKGLLDPFLYEYSFNPCYPYSHDLCANVHGCQTSSFNPEVTYDIASGGTEEMYIDPEGIPYLYYTGPGGKKTFAYLHCTTDKTPRVEAEGDNPVFFEFIFHVYSRDVCPGGHVPGAAIAPGVVGILLILFLIIGVAIYIVVGVIVMKTKYSASGVDLIPNKVFWKNFPGLLKDGVLFVVSPCMKQSPAYSEMKS